MRIAFGCPSLDRIGKHEIDSPYVFPFTSDEEQKIVSIFFRRASVRPMPFVIYADDLFSSSLNTIRQLQTSNTFANDCN